MSNKTKLWIKAALIRAIKTMAQTAIATMSTSAMLSEIDCKVALSSTVLAGVLSLLTSIAGLPEVKTAE